MRISDWSSDVCSSDLRRQSDDDAASQPRMAGDAGAASARLRRFRLFGARSRSRALRRRGGGEPYAAVRRSEEHTSELQSLMRISYDVFCLTNKTQYTIDIKTTQSSQQHTGQNPH